MRRGERLKAAEQSLSVDTRTAAEKIQQLSADLAVEYTRLALAEKMGNGIEKRMSAAVADSRANADRVSVLGYSAYLAPQVRDARAAIKRIERDLATLIGDEQAAFVLKSIPAPSVVKEQRVSAVQKIGLDPEILAAGDPRLRELDHLARAKKSEGQDLSLSRWIPSVGVSLEHRTFGDVWFGQLEARLLLHDPINDRAIRLNQLDLMKLEVYKEGWQTHLANTLAFYRDLLATVPESLGTTSDRMDGLLGSKDIQALLAYYKMGTHNFGESPLLLQEYWDLVRRRSFLVALTIRMREDLARYLESSGGDVTVLPSIEEMLVGVIPVESIGPTLYDDVNRSGDDVGPILAPLDGSLIERSNQARSIPGTVDYWGPVPLQTVSQDRSLPRLLVVGKNDSRVNIPVDHPPFRGPAEIRRQMQGMLADARVGIPTDNGRLLNLDDWARLLDGSAAVWPLGTARHLPDFNGGYFSLRLRPAERFKKPGRSS